MKKCYQTRGENRRPTFVTVFLFIAVPAIFGAQVVADEIPLKLAGDMIQASDREGGVCAVAGQSDAELAVALSKQGTFVVDVLCRRSETCDVLRRRIRADGSYGVVSARTWQGSRLPYMDNLLNVLVIDSYAQLRQSGLTSKEVARALAPLGTAFIGLSNSADSATGLKRDFETAGLKVESSNDLPGRWLLVRKTWPEDIDSWTHFLHGADGNPVAEDRVVGPPRHYQWTGGPAWLKSHETDSSISTMVTERGRLFYIIDRGPISMAGKNPLPDEWYLEARDAFNGVVLWQVPIRRWGWREWKNTWFTNRPGDFPLNIRKRLVAIGDKVYVTLGYRAPVSQLDAKTGELLQTYAGTEGTGEVLYVDGTLVLSVHEGNQIRVMAVDAENGRQLWTSKRAYRGSTTDYLRWITRTASVARPALDPAANMATDGTTVALLDDTEIVALDAHTGAEKWHTRFPSSDADRTAGNIRAGDRLWVGTMIVRDGVVIHASPNALAAFSADTGKLLWSQPKRYIGHLWYEWKDVFVIGQLVWTWSAELDQASIEIGKNRKQREQWPRTVNGYDLKTGKLEKQVSLGSIFRANHHHRCYRNKATSRYILASRRGSEFVDLEQGRHTVDNWARGTCHVGMIPANGLQYVPPHPCQCYIDEKLIGMNALASSLAVEAPPVPDERRLVQGPAFGKITSSRSRQGVGSGAQRPNSGDPGNEKPTARSADWPAFRHDNERSGAVASHVSEDAVKLWDTPLGGKLSPPTAAGGRLFVAQIDAHTVVCLNAQDGKPLWQFTAGARVDSPPTCYRGTVLFGSADGYVYCLSADDGQLVWQFQAAFNTRLIGVNGQLESAWPVHGSVLVQNGTAYFAAGRSSHLDGGILLYALDAATGEIQHKRLLEGPHFNVENVKENYGLPMGWLPDILASDGKNISMRSQEFNSELEPRPGKPALQIPGGFLEGSYFKRIPWTYGTRSTDFARLLVYDDEAAYYVRMFDTLRGLDPSVYFVPGSKGYLLFAKDSGARQNRWQARIPIRVRAMVLAADHLVVAGPPDVVDQRDPLAAFEGRAGGVLNIMDAASGDQLAEHRLAAPPVFNGAAAAQEKLFLVDEQGTVTCFGKP